MRFLNQFILVVVGALVLACALSYPLFTLLAPLQHDMRFDRLATRVFQLLIVVGIIILVRRHQLNHRAAFGFAVPRAEFKRQLWRGFLFGVMSLLPAAAGLLIEEVRIFQPLASTPLYVKWVAGALATGWIVALFEESVFRGLLQGVMRPALGAWPSFILLSMVFAAVHFLGRMPIAANQVTPESGYLLWQSIFVKFNEPLLIIDMFAALWLVGVLLSVLTERSGSTGLAIGMHAGWVTVIKLTIGISVLNPHAAAVNWVNPDDGFVGWWVALWSAFWLVIVLSEPTSLMRWFYPERYSKD